MQGFPRFASSGSRLPAPGCSRSSHRSSARASVDPAWGDARLPRRQRTARVAVLRALAADATRQPVRRYRRRLAIAWWARELDVAAGVIAAMLLKLVTERVVRREMAAYLQVRQRPGTSEPGAVLRGKDVPSKGPSFPSGHVILVAAAACLVAPLLPAGGVWWRSS